MATRHALVRRRIYANLSSWGFSLMNCSFHSFIWIGSIGLKIYIYIYISSSISSHIKTKYEIIFFIHLSYWNLSVQLDSSCAVRQPEALSRFSALCPPQGTPTLRLPTKSTDRKRIAGGNFINFDFLGYSLLFKKIETICGLDIDDVVYNDKHVKVIVTKKLYMSHVHLIWGYYPTPTAPRTKGCRFHLGLRHKVSHGTFCHNLRAHWHGL